MGISQAVRGTGCIKDRLLLLDPHASFSKLSWKPEFCLYLAHPRKSGDCITFFPWKHTIDSPRYLGKRLHGNVSQRTVAQTAPTE